MGGGTQRRCLGSLGLGVVFRADLTGRNRSASAKGSLHVVEFASASSFRKLRIVEPHPNPILTYCGYAILEPFPCPKRQAGVNPNKLRQSHRVDVIVHLQH